MNQWKNWLRCLAACMLVVLLMGGARAVADETIQVNIPAIATGANCTAALYDSLGQRIQLLDLEKDVGNAFVLSCTGLLQTRYKVKMYSEDNEHVTYDRTVYNICIDVYYGAEDQLQASVIIERQPSADGSAPGGKEAMVRFENTPNLPPATETPVPTETPEPTATPVPYTEVFTFRKLWSGDYENSIDWVMYNGDGSVRSKKFNKKVVSESEWHYEAYFQENVDDCYIIEYVPDGYTAYYENVGRYAGVTDRCYNGGTIINRKVPQTGDSLPVGLHLICLLASGGRLLLLGLNGRRRRAG